MTDYGDKLQFNTYSGNTTGHFVRRAGDGLVKTLYKDMDYDQIRMKIDERKFSSHKTLLKLQKFEQITENNKENNLLKHHHLVWQKEFLRLNDMRRRLEHKLEQYMQQNLCQPDLWNSVYKDMDSYMLHLSRDFDTFKTETVDPLWCLREDLQFWIRQNHQELEIASPQILAAAEVIRQTVDSVKKQQLTVMEILSNEQLSLELDLCQGYLGEISVGKNCAGSIRRGIPDEALALDCRDEELKEALLQEFLWLDEKHEGQLGDLELQYRDSLRDDGWSESDRYLFQCVYDQYPTDLQDRRNLVLDRLKRHFPHLSRSQLLRHESSWLSSLYYNNRQNSIKADWSRDKRELITKSSVLFNEANLIHEHNHEKMQLAERQKGYCRELAKKVEMWKELKEEAMQLEKDLQRLRFKEFEETEKRQLEREHKKRRTINDKISKYREKKEVERCKREEAMKERLERLRCILEEQASRDSERVQYRVEELERKNELAKMKEREKVEEDEERERKLEALRCQVRVTAERDPYRVTQQTQSWLNRIKPCFDGETILQKPLFDVNGFTSNQIVSDCRVRVEERLREAGLLNSQYARHVIARLPPPQAPRKDMKSNVFDDDG